MLLSPLLQEYLIENGSLPLPAIGKLTIQNTPAYLKDADKIFVAPDSKIVFADTLPGVDELQQLTTFIAGRLNISNNESHELLENEMNLNAEQEQNKGSINWPEWKLFQNKNDENLQPLTLNDYLPAFPIEKIVRQPDSLTEAPVQTTETTSEVYPEYEEPIAKDYWWVWALVIFLVSVLLILFRYA